MEIKSDVPVMKFCEWCYLTLDENGKCPDPDCVSHVVEDILKDDEDV